MNLKARDKLSLVFAVVIILAGLSVAGCGATAGADSESKVYRVGVLLGVESYQVTVDSFKAKLAELGYEEGKNVSYDVQAAAGDVEQMKQIAQQFVADEVDLIFTTTSPGAAAGKAATTNTDIPVVFAIVVDPAKTGLVDDLRVPGGNATGVSRSPDRFFGKRLEILQRMVPDVGRIWLPYQPDFPSTEIALESVRQAAAALGLEVIETPVNTSQELVAELEKRSDMDDPGFDAIQAMPGGAIQNPEGWQAIAAFAKEQDLPLSGNLLTHARQGALFSYMSDDGEAGRLAAPIAAKILSGGDPATIPVVFNEPRLVINYQVAQSLGLTLEEGLLAQATEIIR